MPSISKQLKRKRDAEERYRRRRNTPMIIEGVDGDLSISDPSSPAGKIKAGEGINVTTTKDSSTISSKGNALTILGKPVDITEWHDGGVLAYSAERDCFYLKMVWSREGMYGFLIVGDDLFINYNDGETPPDYYISESGDLVYRYEDGTEPADLRINENGELILTISE